MPLFLPGGRLPILGTHGLGADQIPAPFVPHLHPLMPGAGRNCVDQSPCGFYAWENVLSTSLVRGDNDD